jgi:hypothetical protein
LNPNALHLLDKLKLPIVIASDQRYVEGNFATGARRSERGTLTAKASGSGV